MGFPGFPFDDYPRFFQDPDENTCVPVCMKMVLEIMRTNVQGIPNLNVKKIADIIETAIDGTLLGANIEKINEKLQTTNPHIQFEID